MSDSFINDALKAAGVETVTAAPPASKPDEPPQDMQGGAFLSGDGRMLYKYTLDGETVVLPKPLDQMSEEDFYALPISMSDGTPGRLPQTLTVKFKDPQWAGHWFNRKAGTGRRVSEAIGLGFVPAKREDCEWVCHSLNDEDGAIIDHDLVLMKIHKAKLFLKFKGWMDTARKMGGIESYKNKAENSLHGNGMGKVDHYLTPQAVKEYSGLGPVVSLPTHN